MSIKRISRRRVAAPIVEHVHEEQLSATTKEGRKTPQDDRHAPGRGPSWSHDPLRASVPINKASVPTTKSRPR